MLQLPILELRGMIQQEIEQNPTIEEKLIESEPIEVEPGTGKTEQAEEMEFDKEFEALAKLDEEWRDYFFQDLDSRPYTPEDEEKHQFLMDSLPQRESLQEHLLMQLHFSEMPEKDRQMAELLIGSINNDGYLVGSIEELAASANCDREHLQDLLTVIQDFHPTGVGARDLRECLLLQLERSGNQDALVAEIVSNHLDDVAARKIPDIARAVRSTPEEVERAVGFISSLDPKPGRIYSDDTSTYVLPEVVIVKVDGRYQVVLNDEQLPHVRISRHYREMLSSSEVKPEVKSYIRERIRSGAFLIKSIHQRQRTIHKIASEIVGRQSDFLDKGVSHLRPMTMAEVAGAVSVHETTVSRAVSGKYMKTPIGVFEMKYFFTPGIKTADGTELSNKSVKEMIASMVAREDPSHPLSDQEIMERLHKQGLRIARRTIAKYRLVLHIPPSHMRKTY
jgi:RNA polymerase sigma-54 factor